MKKKHTRRNFIAYSALAGAVASFLPAFLSAGTGKEFSSGPFEGKKGPVFLFQGDSITDGNRGRNADPNHIMGHGYAFAIASRVGADFPTEGYTFYNRGVSGNTITDLEKRWQQDTLDIAPDVLSILIGVNDAGAWVEKGPALKILLFSKPFTANY